MKTEHFFSFLLTLAFSSYFLAGVAPLRYAFEVGKAGETNEEKIAFWFEKEDIEERAEKKAGSETHPNHSGSSGDHPPGFNRHPLSSGLSKEVFLNALQTKYLQSCRDHIRQLLCVSTHPPLYIFLCTFKGVLPL